MILIDHPEGFMKGLRVLFLTGRNKDGASKRKIFRISKNEDRFQEMLLELESMAQPGERIYASASARDVKKASIKLKHLMVDNDQVPEPMEFYESLNSRWVSCLMDPTCQAPKTWMFDCDSFADYGRVTNELNRLSMERYEYPTKNGYHILVKPFNKSLIEAVGVTTLIHDNPLMLWGY